MGMFCSSRKIEIGTTLLEIISMTTFPGDGFETENFSHLLPFLITHTIWKEGLNSVCGSVLKEKYISRKLSR